MRGSRNFCQAGGGGMGSRLDGQKTVWTMYFLVINLFYSLQSVSNGFITEGRRGSNFFQGVGVSIETHITCDFPEEGGGGCPDPLIPLWFAYRIMVYQNLNKTEKYHPTTTIRKKKRSAGRDSKCDPEGGPDPLENYNLYGFLYGISNWTPLEKVGPLWNLEK